MRIGLTFNVKTVCEPPPGTPDDLYEEFDGPETVEAIAEVFRGRGHEVVLLGDGPAMLRRLLDKAPDFVFNFAEGTGSSRSREARVPAVLEMLEIPYSGSDPFTLGVTLDKACAKPLVGVGGVATPKWTVVESGEGDPVALAESSGVGYPAICKPAYEGSSKGIRARSIVDTPGELAEAVSGMLAAYRQPVLVEEFIEGDDITVALLGNPPRVEVLGVMRVLPKAARTTPARFVYSLEMKRDFENLIDYECPAQLPADTLERIAEDSLRVFSALGCRDYARVDFRVREGRPYFLETNPLPGLSPKSGDYVILARKLGWTYPEVIWAIAETALARLGLSGPASARSCSSLSDAAPLMSHKA